MSEQRTEQTAEQRLPCPFCGCTDLRVNEPDVGGFEVMCWFCAASGPNCDSREEAINEWNNRTTK